MAVPFVSTKPPSAPAMTAQVVAVADSVVAEVEEDMEAVAAVDMEVVVEDTKVVVDMTTTPVVVTLEVVDTVEVVDTLVAEATMEVVVAATPVVAAVDTPVEEDTTVIKVVETPETGEETNKLFSTGWHSSLLQGLSFSENKKSQPGVLSEGFSWGGIYDAVIFFDSSLRFTLWFLAAVLVWRAILMLAWSLEGVILPCSITFSF